AGRLSAALVAPNAVSIILREGLLPNVRQKQSINRTRDRLVRQGLLMRKNGLLRLTARGQNELFRIELTAHGKTRFPRWDGRWRMLIFDIPEHRRGLREKIRRALIAIGFQRLQDSVWAFPYDCEDFITLLKADFRVGKDMLYLIVDELEG